jgi:hypothetical protein
MKRFLKLAALGLITLGSTTAFSQSRDLGARRLILDDGGAGRLTLEYTGPGTTTFTFPTGSSTTVGVGTTTNATLSWDGSAWVENVNLLGNPAGGIAVTGGIDNNAGGVTEVGSISGATTMSGTDNITLWPGFGLGAFGDKRVVINTNDVAQISDLNLHESGILRSASELSILTLMGGKITTNANIEFEASNDYSIHIGTSGLVTGHNLSVAAGTGADNGGDLNLVGGAATTTNGGALTIAGGAGSAGTGGAVSINGGVNTAGTYSPVSINTSGIAGGNISMGNGFGTFALNSSNIDVSTAGAITGATGITSSGNVLSTGTLTFDPPTDFAGISTTSEIISITGRDEVGDDYPLVLTGDVNGQTFGTGGGQTLGRLLRLAQDGAVDRFYDMGIDGSGNFYVMNQGTTTQALRIGVSGGISVQSGALTLATDLAVSEGGTGASTLASNGVLYGNGTGAVQALAVNASATPMFLTQVSSGAPSWSTGGSNFIVNGTTAQTTANFNIDGDGTIGDDLTVSGIINLPASTAADGRITVAGSRFMHAFNGTFLGTNAGTLTATGANNVAMGGNAMNSVTTGAINVGIGDFALQNVTTGSSNAALGHAALRQNVTGSNNIAMGYHSLYNNTAGNNSGLGYLALTSNTTGAGNTALGFIALQANTTGNSNTAVGANALITNTSGASNTALGVNADVATGALTNATAIGANAVATASNQMMLGNSSVTSVATYGSLSDPGSALTVDDDLTVNGAVTLGDAAADILTLTGTVAGDITFSDASHAIRVATSAGNGNMLEIYGQQGAASNIGGDLRLYGGNGGATSGNGGHVLIQGGTPVDGNGGWVTIQGWDGAGPDAANGGNAYVNSGSGVNGGTDGILGLNNQSNGAINIGNGNGALTLNTNTIDIAGGAISGATTIEAVTSVSTPSITGATAITVQPTTNGGGAGYGLTLDGGTGTGAAGGNVTISGGAGTTAGDVTINAAGGNVSVGSATSTITLGDNLVGGGANKFAEKYTLTGDGATQIFPIANDNVSASSIIVVTAVRGSAGGYYLPIIESQGAGTFSVRMSAVVANTENIEINYIVIN